MLVGALGNTPESVISVHLLFGGLADAFVAGEVACLDGVAVQGASYPGELMSFGSDVTVLWQLLRLVRGWWYISVAETCAGDLGAMLEAQTGGRIRYYADLCHVLRGPASRLHHEAARLLSGWDLEPVEGAPVEARGNGWGGAREIVRGRRGGRRYRGEAPVPIAFTSALSPRHAHVAASTLRGWRGWGVAAAAASLVARGLQETGRTSVWSTGEDNLASLRVAHKLGFAPVARRLYIIPE